MPIARDRLRLTDDELEELMSGARELHVATVSADGRPHVVPLWFVWHDGTVWVNNLRRSRRSRDLASGSQVSLCVDDGVQYQELRGATFYGRFVEATGDERLAAVRAQYGVKYWGGIDVPEIRSHVWLRLERDAADGLATWDFRKIPTGRDARVEATRDTSSSDAD
jgi:hypothetical protein